MQGFECPNAGSCHWHANHTIKPDVVTVGGKDEKHPEGNYYLCAGQLIPAGPDALKAQRQRHALLSGNSQEYACYSGQLVPKAVVVQSEEMVANGRKRVKDEISKYLDNMIASKRPGKSVRMNRNFLNAFVNLMDERHDGEIKEAVQLARCVGALDGYVELKRSDGSTTVLRIVWRMLPRNGGRALFLLCPHCDAPRRFVYGWEWDSFSGWSNRVRRTDWCCRSCNRLRYSSEGGYLRPGVMFRAFGSLPRPGLWLPYVFTSPEDASKAGLVSLR